MMRMGMVMIMMMMMMMINEVDADGECFDLYSAFWGSFGVGYGVRYEVAWTEPCRGRATRHDQ